MRDRVVVATGFELDVREGDHRDTNYVLSSWLRSYWEVGDFERGDRELYYRTHQAWIKRAIARADLRVATLAGHEDALVAWWVREGTVLHYVLVKPIYRRAGLMSLLLEEEPLEWCSARPRTWHVYPLYRALRFSRDLLYGDPAGVAGPDPCVRLAVG